MGAWWEGLPRDRFGDSPAMNDKLAALVLAGRKRATCMALTHHDPAVSSPGVRSVIEDGAGRPVCVIETTSIEVRGFEDVDEAFAREEGEGDLTLGWWRAAHQAFFEREGSYAPGMQVVCERFSVVEVLS